ncbi:MAG: D-alanyl-D-alanine carboxypeptidase [Coriobacteriaceae bacterium]|nr:D-alanyl-D-alanine carboxypeptidase [Coriobacteriaceae bacterium]
MPHLHPSRLLAALSLAAGLVCLPVPAFASRLDADLICGTAASTGAFAESDLPDIEAKASIVVGQDGTVYFEREADTELKIASITKVMTAIVALENADVTDTITVDHAAATVGQSSADLEEGDTMPLSVALKALLMASGNDAAMAIATSVGRKIDPSSSDPYDTFIDAMNAKAKELGMEHSLFTNPHGLDFDGWEADMHSTARDVATMFAHAMKSEDFRAIDGDADRVITVRGKDGANRSITLKDRNELRGQDGNIGGKTGGTYIALQCFVGAFKRDLGGEVYTVTLGSDGDAQRWADTRTVASWYYNHMAAYPLVTTVKTTADGSPLVARVTNEAWSDRTVDVTVEDPSATVAVFSLAGEVKMAASLNPVNGGVRRGEEVGTLSAEQGGRTLASVKLIAAEDQAGPNPLEWLLVQADRVVRFFTGEPGAAAGEELFEVPKATDLDAA